MKSKLNSKKLCYREVFKLSSLNIKKKKVNNYKKCALKVGDLVEVITGQEKKKRGKILKFDRKLGKIMVEGIRMQTHFKKEGGIEIKEGFIDVSNVQFVNPENGKLTRHKKKILNTMKKDSENKTEEESVNLNEKQPQD